LSTNEEPVAGVRRYFDNTASAFERLGQGSAALHRAVWGDGVTTRRQAFAYVDSLIAKQAATTGERPRLLDLGCGLGASLVNIAEQLPGSTGVGVTISPKQAQRAAALVAAAGLGERLRCVEADYHNLPDDLGLFDVAFAIEAFVHTTDPQAFFKAAALRVRSGGWLIVCDDFRGRPARRRYEQSLIDRFCKGWSVNTLITVDDTRAAATHEGFELIEIRDLTAELELRRPRDILLAALVAVVAPFRPSSSLLQSWIGGDALQRCLLRRLVEYRLLIFKRRRS